MGIYFGLEFEESIICLFLLILSFYYDFFYEEKYLMF